MPTQLHAKPRIAFDTNMLLAIQQLNVDVFSEARKMFGEKALFAMPKEVKEELRDLAESNKSMSKAVGIAMQEIANHCVKIVDVDAGNADDALAKMAAKGYLIASNDALLRKRIKGFGGKVIYLRQRHFLKIG